MEIVAQATLRSPWRPPTCRPPGCGHHRGRITDQDDGFTEYTTIFTVNNVAPTTTFFSGDTTVDESGTATHTYVFSIFDPGVDNVIGVGSSCGVGGSPVGGNTYDDTSVTFTCTFPDGPADPVLIANATDSDNATGPFTSQPVHVNNVAPTASLANNGPIAEGSSGTVTFSGQADASSVDQTAGFTYSYDFDNNGTFEIAGSASASATVPAAYLADGPGSRTVRGRIIDKNNGFTDYTTTISITNVAPTVIITGAPLSSPEGMLISLGSAVSDPSAADVAAGFTFAWSVTKNGSPYASGTSPTFSFTPDDNGTYVVSLSVTDKDGDSGSAGKTIAVTNVAPTASLANNGPIAEGSSGTVTFSGQADASSVDQTAGFTYSYDFDNDGLFEITGSASASATVPAAYLAEGPGSRTVGSRIIDKDGGFNDYTTTISITNVAPTATLSAGTPINEGSSSAVTFSSPLDPSSVDTVAGFHYAFSCTDGSLAGTTYAGSSTSPTTNCLFDDNGSYTVRARIIDEDDGFTEYTATVGVNNVPPTGTLVVQSPIDEGSSSELHFDNQFDPSTADTTAGFHYSFACTSSIDDLIGSYALTDGTNTYSCPFADNGFYGVGGRIIDKDNGSYTSGGGVTVNNVAPIATFSATSPIDEGSSSAVSLHQSVRPGLSSTQRAGFHYAFSCSNGESVRHHLRRLPARPRARPAPLPTTAPRHRQGPDHRQGRRLHRVHDNRCRSTTSPAGDHCRRLQSARTRAVQSRRVRRPWTDPAHTGRPMVVTIDWGDGAPVTTSPTIAAVTSTFSANHVYDDNDVYTVTVHRHRRRRRLRHGNTTARRSLTSPRPRRSATMARWTRTTATVTFSNQFDPSPIDTAAGFRYGYDLDNDGTFEVGDGHERR